MPSWLISLLEIFAPAVIKWALQLLEQKYPGLTPIINQILAWLGAQAAAGNANAMPQLAAHVDKLCSGIACPPDLKNS